MKRSTVKIKAWIAKIEAWLAKAKELPAKIKDWPEKIKAWPAKVKEWPAQIKENPWGWLVALVVILAAVVWWIKKIIGFDSLGINVDYPAVKGMAIVMLILSVAALAVILGYVLKKKEFHLHQMFVRCGMLLGALYLFILPPLSAPDEWVHYITAFKLSSELMGMESTVDDERVLAYTEEAEFRSVNHPDAEHYEYFWSNYFGQETDEEMISTKARPNGYYMIPYIPQALGITLARVLGLNFASRLLFGRIVNLIWSVLAIAAAIKWIPFGKKTLFGVAMLPMVLHELASNSYDAWITAFSLMFIAYCMKLGYEKERVERKDIAILAVLISLLAPCKVVYAPLVGLCLLIPVKKFGGVKRWIAAAGIVLGAVVLFMVLFNTQILLNFATKDTADNIVSWADEPGYTIGYLLEHPREYLQIILNTLKVDNLQNVKNYVDSMLGRALGWLDPNLTMPRLYYMALLVLFLGHCFSAYEEPKVFRRGNKIWMSALSAVIALLIMTSMLIYHTPLSETVVHGVQGRYFLPILPLLIMVVFRDSGLVFRRDNQKVLSAAYAVFHVFLLIRLFGQTISVHLIPGA